MMIYFWLMISVMIVCALSFVVLPLWCVDGSVFSSKVGHEVTGEGVTARHSQWGLMLFLVVFLPVTSLVLYLSWGDSKGLSSLYSSREQALVAQKFRKTLGNPQQVIEVLKQHLAKDPHSAQGWYLLGRLYLSQQQFAEAVTAFAKADALEPNKPEVIFQYAQALYFQQHSLKGKPTELLQQLLQLQPQNDAAINLLAISAYQQGEYQQAIDYWERLLPKYPANSTDGQALLSAIAKAQAGLRR